MDEEVEVHGEGEEALRVPRKLTAADERRRKQRPAVARPAHPRWKTPGERRSYSSRMLDALRYVLSRDAPPSAPTLRRRAVREAADRALAVAAGGRTRWSRGILSSCRALKLRKKRRVVAPRCACRSKQATQTPAVGTEEEEARAMARKVRVLGMIVPGCQRVMLPSLLEEAADYISALEMQVRIMSALAQALSSRDRPVGASNATTSSSTSSPANL